MGFFKEFKEFAMKGNVMDMAVGVIIGGAFGKIVSSLVADVLMPIISLCTGGIDFIIIAFCIFLMIKAMNKLNRKKEEPAPEAPAGPTQEELLAEIRDLLKQK